MKRSAERTAERLVDNCAKDWLGRQDSNLRMPVPKTGALPLGDAPAAGGRLAAGERDGKSARADGVLPVALAP
jgi:hypothetical protein